MKHTNFIPIELRGRPHPSLHLSVFVWLFFLFGIGQTSLNAQATWTGAAADNDWANAINWMGGVLPVGHPANFGTQTLIINGTPATAPDLTGLGTINFQNLEVNAELDVPTGVILAARGRGTATIGAAINGVLTVESGGKLLVDNYDGIDINVASSGTLNIMDSLLVHNDKDSLLVKPNSIGLNVEAGGIVNIDATGFLGICGTAMEGILNDGTITNDGFILINNSNADGVQNMADFINNAIVAINDTEDNGILNMGTGDFDNTADGALLISNAVMNGIKNNGDFEDLGLIAIDHVGIDGINNMLAATFLTMDTICIGSLHPVTGSGAGVGIVSTGISNAGTFGSDGDGTLVKIRNAPTSISNTGTFENDPDASGNCTVVDVDNGIQVTSGTMTNNGVLQSSAPFNTSSGAANAIVNTGILVDEFGSFFDIINDDPLRTLNPVLNTSSGIVVALYTALNYYYKINPYLLGLADPSTHPYYTLSPSFTENGQVVATLDLAANELTLNKVKQNFDLDFNIIKKADGRIISTGSAAIRFTNQPSSAIACNQNVQVSLDSDCTAPITPDMILEGVPDVQLSNFIVNILEGSRAGSDTVDLSYLNQKVKVEVIDTSITPNNKCWGYITVEDKIAPELTCSDLTVFCNTSTDPAVIGGQPSTDEACAGGVTFTYADLTQNFNCVGGNTGEPDTISRIIRTWQGTDESGNTSTCQQTIHVIKPQLTRDSIIWPTDIVLYCGNNPSTEPDSTGFPLIRFNGDTVSVDQFCLFGVSHQDQPFTTSTCQGTRKVLRTWTIFDWCHPDSVFSNALVPGPQLIKVQDTIGPVITNLPVPTEIQVTFPDLNSCVATVVVPPVTVSDVCSDSIKVKVQIANTTINTNGGNLSNIPFGMQNVIYIATDDCGNTTRDTIKISIEDNIAPTVICKENLVVSLTQSGTAQVIAEAFNNGSYDNCALDSIRVRRMDSCGVAIDTLPYTTFVEFECCDVGQERMVQLGVWDEKGNFNSCMVRVTIQDKVVPTITCPPDVTVTCDTNLTDLSIFGPASVSGGSCNATSLSYTETRNFQSCSIGTIERTWTVPNTTVTCTQTITVNGINNDSFNITRLPQPEIFVQCGTGIDIRSLGVDSVQVENMGCQILGIQYDQQVFIGNGDCEKVLRTWIITDLCRNPQALPGMPGYKVVTQMVNLVDSIAPTFTNTVDTVVADADHTLCSSNVVLPTFGADDSCGTIPTVRINGIVMNASGGMDTLVNAVGGDTLKSVKVGTYSVIYTATDGCNNKTSRPLVIVVRDNEGPTVFCDDLVTTLTLKADEHPDSLNRGWITVWASDFNCKVNDCDTTEIVQVLKFPTGGIGQSTPPADTSFGWTFNCGDKDAQVGDLWVRDGAGNWDYVRVTVDIQDNMDICPPPRPGFTGGAMISGTIQTEMGDKVDEVTVNIGGYTMNPMITGIDGNYQFEELPMHNNYTVAPEKNIQPLNGVSTFDLVLISKHILGLNKLDSPYKHIAADVNRSGTITAYDLVQLRQLILNVNTEFPNNTSWRFVDAEFQFETENPASESFSEVASFGDLDANTEAHFIAVKVGDVNTNAIANRGIVSTESRSRPATLDFSAKEVNFTEGDLFNVDFSLRDLETVEGYQFTLNLNPSKLEIVSVETGIAKAGNFGMRLLKRGQLTTSWNQGAELVQDEERMFSLVVRAKQNGKLSEVINISSELTQAEAYNTSGEVLDVALNFEGHTARTREFALHNNKPNPFKEGTIISFDLPEAGAAKVTIFDISGRTVKAINREFNEGYNEVRIDKAALKGSGIYFYQLETATNTAKKKMIMIE